MKLFLSFIVWSINRFWPFALLLFSFLVLLIVLRIVSRKEKVHLIPIMITSLIPTGIAVFLLVFFRNVITVPIIYNLGVESRGRVVSSEDTNSIHNDQPVIKYNVVFKDKKGEIVESSFRTSDFNVYPLRNRVHYPTTGSDFNLRYLEDFPTEFIIMTDEKEEELRKLYEKAGELRQRLDFDPEDHKAQEELEEVEEKIRVLEE